MSFVNKPSLPMPTTEEVRELVTFLAANVSVSNIDGNHEKAVRFQALLDTANALVERAGAATEGESRS